MRETMATNDLKVKFELSVHKQDDRLYLAVTRPKYDTGGETFFLKIELPVFETEANFINTIEQINARLRETE